MKASNQTKQIQVVTIEIDDPAEVAALRSELVRYNETTGVPQLSVMAKLAKVVLDAIQPKPTMRIRDSHGFGLGRELGSD